jgi:RNA polymerase sigma-70 factor (ECF subfamily)
MNRARCEADGTAGANFMASIEADELGRLFDATAPALVLYARQWCDGPGAEDAVQEAFLTLARQSEAPNHPAAWLHRVVRNGVISAARNRKRRETRETRASRSESWFSAVDDRLDAQQAARSLAELEPDCREVIVARIWGGLTFEQIAALQGCSLTTAHRRYQAGLSQLHERLERPCATSRPTT